MKKIGFIDLFIDEWHSNNYPKWIAESSRKDEFEVAYAWEEKAKEGRRDLAHWCKDMNIAPVASIQEIVEKSDCLCVLAPANPEAHERLAELALASGKPVYIDKPFAVDLAMAERIFALAGRHQTPLMSCSALRFTAELAEFQKETTPLEFAGTTGGGGNFPEYAIHQIEMVVSTMGTNVESVTVIGAPSSLSATLQFSDGRIAVLNYNPNFSFTFRGLIGKKNIAIPECTRYFENLIEGMLKFFATGESPIPSKQTLAIAAIRSAVVQGMEHPGERIFPCDEKIRFEKTAIGG